MTNGNSSQHVDTHRTELNSKLIGDSNESQKRKPEISETRHESPKNVNFKQNSPTISVMGFNQKDAHELFHFLMPIFPNNYSDLKFQSLMWMKYGIVVPY